MALGGGPVLSAPLPEACDDVGECATRDNACAALCRMLQGPPGALDPAEVVRRQQADRVAAHAHTQQQLLPH